MILLFSHSPSVIKPSQAMGTVRVNKEGEKPMEQYILPSALFYSLHKDIPYVYINIKCRDCGKEK